MQPQGRLTFGLFHQAWGVGEQSDAECLRQVVDTTIRGDRLGFEAAWFTEQHARMFPRWWGRLPAPHLLIAHLAARTSEIRLGTAVKLLALDEPVHVAEEMLMLNMLTDGRSLHGVGAGVSPGLDGSAVDRHARRALFRENLAAVLAILRADPTATPYPLPLEPHDLSSRMYIAATDPRSLEMAAEEGLGYLVGMFGGSRHGELVSRFRDAGGTGPARAARMVYVSRDDGTAHRDVSAAARFFYDNFTPPVESWRRALKAAGPPANLEELLERIGWVVGGPEKVAHELEAYAVASHLDGIDLSFHAPGLDGALADRAMERFAEEVRPRIRPLAHV